MAKEDKNKNIKTEFHKKIVSLLAEHGYVNIAPENVAICVDNINSDAYVNYNYMATSIKFPKKDFEKMDVIDAGFKYWSTWLYGEGFNKN